MDLDLIPTDELLKTIAERFDHMIFMGIKDMGVIDRQYKRRWFGSNHMCMGMAADLNHEILNDLLDREEPIKPEEM